MSNQDNQDEADLARDRHEQRVMWGFTAGVVLLILGMMGANMLFHHDRPAAGDSEISSQSRPTPAQ
jgi:hypothetical protein